jgi:hypothetical protein
VTVAFRQNCWEEEERVNEEEGGVLVWACVLKQMLFPREREASRSDSVTDNTRPARKSTKAGRLTEALTGDTTTAQSCSR